MDNLTSNSNIILNMLIQSARELGFPVNELIALLPDGTCEDANEETRYPADKVPLIWQWLEQQSSESNVGFRLARQLRLKSQTMLAFLMMSSETLGAGLDKVIKFQHLISEAIKCSIEVQDNDCSFVFQSNSDPDFEIRQQNEYAALLFHHWLSDLLGKSWRLKRIDFAHPKPCDVSEHKKLFQCELLFSASVNRFIFEESLLKLPIPYANERMNRLHEQHAEQLELQIKKRKLVNQVISLISENLMTGDIHINEVAKKCQLSERQLKSQLEHEGTSFTELLDNTRKERAVMLLTSTDKNISDIADACGFSEPSTFNRAFKRWFNTPPSKYRRSTGN